MVKAANPGPGSHPMSGQGKIPLIAKDVLVPKGGAIVPGTNLQYVGDGVAVVIHGSASRNPHLVNASAHSDELLSLAVHRDAFLPTLEGVQPIPLTSTHELHAVMEDLAAPDTALHFWSMNPLQRVNVVKLGIPASAVPFIAKRMDLPLERAYKALGLPSSTMARRVKSKDLLAPEQSERVLDIVRLVGLVEEIVQDSVPPEVAAEFDAAKWLGEWIERPQPSLGMRCPSEYLDTATGIEVVETLLKRIAAGAFA